MRLLACESHGPLCSLHAHKLPSFVKVLAVNDALGLHMNQARDLQKAWLFKELKGSWSSFAANEIAN